MRKIFEEMGHQNKGANLERGRVGTHLEKGKGNPQDVTEGKFQVKSQTLGLKNNQSKQQVKSLQEHYCQK